jgi:hypothetical protein
MKKPIMCVDFDGVIHSYTTPWINEFTIPDPPVSGALAWLWEATKHFTVHIYSSRSKTEAGRNAMQTWLCNYAKAEFPPNHPMCWEPGPAYPIIFSHEKPPAFLTIDDRALTFNGTWENLVPANLLNFKSWNKR